MKLCESIKVTGKISESNRENLPEGVLVRVTYPICNIGKLNANNRVYERDVWEKVLHDQGITEKMGNRALFGQAEHPAETQSDLQLTSHVIHEMWMDESTVYQALDVLDTPTGRIIDTLLRAGCQVGVSTRAEGDLEEFEVSEGGQPKKCQRVIADSYHYVTTDFTADPSTFGVAPHNVQMNVESTVRNIKSMNANERKFATVLLESLSEGQTEVDKKIDRGMSLLADNNDSVDKVMDQLMSEESINTLDEEEWAQVNFQLQNYVDSMEDRDIEESKLNEKEFPELSKVYQNLKGENELALDAIGYFIYGSKEDDNSFIDPYKYRVVSSRESAEELQVKASEILLDKEQEIVNLLKEENWEELRSVVSNIQDQLNPIVEESRIQKVIRKSEVTEEIEKVNPDDYVFAIEDSEYEAVDNSEPQRLTWGEEHLDPGYYLLDKEFLFKIDDQDFIYAANPEVISKVKEYLNLEDQWSQEPVKNVPNESNMEEANVIMKGGSIGSKERKGKHFDSDKEAQEYAKRMNSRLSPGEKKYYKIKYVVIPDEESKTNEAINVYKIVDGSVTDIPEEDVVREGSRYVHKDTGKDVILDQEKSGSALVANQSESKVDESEDINKMYSNAGLPAPKGKGEHTKAFHELAIKIAKGYIKNGDSPSAALDKAYPTAMKQLGRDKAVHKSHWAKESVNEGLEIYVEEDLEIAGFNKGKEYQWNMGKLELLTDNQNRINLMLKVLGKKYNVKQVGNEIKFSEKENESIKQIHSQILDLKVAEAIAREDVKNLLEESKSLKDTALAYRILKNKLVETTTKNKILESENSSLCNLLKNRARVSAELKSKLEESTKKESELSTLNENHKKIVLEAKDQAIALGRKQVLKEYFELKLKAHKLQIDENTQTLIEDCIDLQDVNNLMERLISIARRSALHSPPIKEFKIQESKVSEEDVADKSVDKAIGNLMKRMN